MEQNICKILNINTDSKFTVKNDPSQSTFYINKEGYIIKADQDCSCMDSVTLCEIINNPSLIVPEKRWTLQDVEDAKAVSRLFPYIVAVERENIHGYIYLINARNNVVDFIADTGPFPSLNDPEEIVALSEIIGKSEDEEI